MLRPVHSIRIGENSFDFLIDGLFESTWKNLTDTGSIALPHRFSKGDKVVFAGENNFFKKGDAVIVESGYFPIKEHLFEGYVSGIKPSIPVEIMFEDAAWLLKQTNITMSFKKVSLLELLTAALNKAIENSEGLLKEGLQRVVLNVVDANLGAFRITNVNITGILQELKKTYALTSYFRGHELFVGLAYGSQGKRRAFEFNKDIIDDGTDLEYLKETDVSFKVKAVSMLENNTKIEVQVGDPNGEQRTITKYNLGEKELREAAEREISNLRYEGFRGQIKTFLQPVMYHGDEVEIIDLRRPERNGVYLVESVSYEIGVNGSFQVLKLGVKIG